MKKIFYFGFVLAFFFSGIIAADFDARSYQHGIDLIPQSDGRYILIWSSSGISPTGKLRNGNWTHDVFYSRIDPATTLAADAIKIIAKPEAQEPASSAVSDDGNIMITMEDGWNVEHQVGQRFGIYDREMKPVRPYPSLVQDGGHSGHVTAVGNRFVVFYSDDWVDGGGVDDLGSGDDVVLKVYDSTGKYQRSKAIAVGETTRDWWPLLAGSTNHALLVWQRFVEDQTYADLVYAVYDPKTGQFVKEAKVLRNFIKYYTYDVQYISSIDRFLIVGTDSLGGFGFLLDNNGTIIAKNTLLPSAIREAQPAVQQQAERATIVYPMYPSGVMVLSVTNSSISLENTLFDKYNWSSIGTDGIFLNKRTAYFISLSPTGLVETKFKINK